MRYAVCPNVLVKMLTNCMKNVTSLMHFERFINLLVEIQIVDECRGKFMARIMLKPS